MSDYLQSFALNEILKIAQNKDSGFQDLIYCASNLYRYYFRNEPLNEAKPYEHVLIPAVKELAEDIYNGGKFATKFVADEYAINWDDDLTFEEPFLTHMGYDNSETALETVALRLRHRKEMTLEEPERTEAVRAIAKKYLDNQLRLRNEGYHGKYPKINELLSGTVIRRISGPFEQLNGHDIEDLVSYLTTQALIFSWHDYMQVYRFTDTLTDDFIAQPEITLPADALKHMPFSCFAIDLSKNKSLKTYFDSVFVQVSKTETGYHIVYKSFDNTGLNTNYSLAQNIDDEGSMTITDDTLKELIVPSIVKPANEAKVELAQYIKDIMSLRRCATGSIRNDVEKLSKTNFFTYHDTYEVQNEIQHMDKILLDKFEDFKPLMTSAYRKLHKFIIGAIFYLCCANKTVKKSADDPVAIKDSDSTKIKHLRLEDLGIELDDEELIINNSHLIDKTSPNITDVDDPTEHGHRKSSTRRPHLVRGHFHNFRVGKGRKEILYKYVNPYYTGTKRKIVSVTDVK